VTGSRRDRLDTWLFLPPELERDGPALLGLLDDPAAPERTRAARASEVEALVVGGTPERWRGYLRELGELVSRALAGEPPSEVRAAGLRLAAILLEQQLLAPGVPHWQVADEGERRRLEGLLAAHGVAIDDA
jgi:hypothetical protein